MATKAILVDAQALDGKYGDSAAQVWQALDRLIEADGERGTQTELVKLDDSGGPAGQAAIGSGAGWEAVKRAVDAVAEAGDRPPDYMLLLGGPDLLPHCELENPTPDDGDPTVPSDLPYACDADGGTSISDFLAPTRVVSRVPDVPGASDPSVLLRELELAIGWQERPRRLYDARLAISAEVWELSTQLSLTQLFGSHEGLQVSPPDGPDWEPALLGSRSHFANLHGSPRSTRYVGQRGASYPVAHDAALVEGRLEEGTVAAVEACYGAELFEPDGQLPMPLAYLRSGAYAFFGSTTIAYGPADANDWADVLCGLFLTALFRSASVGRAGLEARQEYIAQTAPLDPIDLKTVAQFLILGDPSVSPVARIDQGEQKAAPGPEGRRERLRMKGQALRDVPRWAEPLDQPPPEGAIASLRELSVLETEAETSVRSFGLVGAPAPHGVAAAAAAGARKSGPATMHLLMQEFEQKDAPMPPQVAVLAVEVDGQLVSVKTAMTR